MNPEDDKAVNAPLDSAHCYLAVADLDRFRTGRSRSDILKDLHWRADSVEMADCKGKALGAITYGLLSDGQQSEECKVFLHALFVNDKFVKFINWLPNVEEVPYKGTTRSHSKRVHIGDCSWLARAMETKALTIEALRKEANSPSPKHSPDIGLTIAWLLLRPALRIPSEKPLSVDDYKKNAALRDQFNAARLDLGMTESEVETILKAKPLEQGKVDAGLYKIYGSNESFNINHLLHFSNVLVLFREGKATAVYSIGAGQDWRRNLSEAFLDLPKRAAADSSKSR